MYRDLRPDDVREVLVHVDGHWITGELEAYRRDDAGWSGWVRYATAPGEIRIGWFGEDALRSVKD